MKIIKKFKKHYFYIILILTISNNLLKCQELIQYMPSDLGQADQLDQSLIMHFLRQPKYTNSSVICFLKHTYNNKYYAEKFLAFNFSHLSTLLEYAKKSSLPRKYICNVLFLFNQKISELNYINSYAFLELLEKLNLMLKPHFNAEKEEAEKIELIQAKLYNLLTDDFQELKKNPKAMLNKVSSSIYDIFNNKNEESKIDSPMADVKLGLTLFLSNTISRLVWSPTDQINAWYCVKLMSGYLTELLNNKILDEDHINQLMWNLTTRFAYFLSILGEFLTIDTYDQIYKDLDNKELFLFAVQEKEPHIRTKAQYFADVIDMAKMKVYILNQQNLISDS